MKYSLMIIISIMLALTGCKEEVNFSAVEDVQRSQSPGLVEPVDPVTPNGGPVVRILKAPSDHLVGEETDVNFEVIAGDFAVESVECFVNQVAMDCNAEKGYADLGSMPLGSHEFSIVATDIEGLKGEAIEYWDVMNDFRKQRDELLVEESGGKTDILFVVDNSSSMRSEQRKISQRFDRFVQQIRGLDWHIGITTTDPRLNLEWSDGVLTQFDNDAYFLTSSMEENQAQRLFAKNVRRKESGWDTEEGIKATYRAVERAISGRKKEDDRLRRFFREEAALAVVLVSDEDESRDRPKNRGSNLIQLIADNWGAEKLFQFNSIITHTQECLNGPGQSMGYKYEELSRRTGGTVGDICADNYSQLLKDIGKGVADLQKVHKLKCQPQDIDGDGSVDLEIVARDGSEIPAYSLDGESVKFDEPLDSDMYEFNYYCLAN